MRIFGDPKPSGRCRNDVQLVMKASVNPSRGDGTCCDALDDAWSTGRRSALYLRTFGHPTTATTISNASA